jgi:hypothetical protein
MDQIIRMMWVRRSCSVSLETTSPSNQCSKRDHVTDLNVRFHSYCLISHTSHFKEVDILRKYSKFMLGNIVTLIKDTKIQAASSLCLSRDLRTQGYFHISGLDLSLSCVVSVLYLVSNFSQNVCQYIHSIYYNSKHFLQNLHSSRL